jgi:hypothetical protein
MQTPTEHVLRIRVALLEDAIRMHRRMVRDHWQSRWTDRDPNEYLWRHLDD